MFLGSDHALADDVDVTIVGGQATSNIEEVRVATIAPPGQAFSGTLTTRSAIGGWDTVLAVYTDKSRTLWVNVEGSDAGNAEANRESNVSFLLVAGPNKLGTVTFDPETGDLLIAGVESWFQGTVMGMHARY